MSTTARRFLCRLLGHRYDEWAISMLGHHPDRTITATCLRCGHEDHRV